ncbi:MAG: zinc ribbon domain-containing protein [Planctomycetota bacterium]|nr:zinc ribbon domain-containing protein [Planctomycetota bacterium]
MPTYDYECGACEHTFEVFQSIKDPLKRKCPACGKSSLRRLIGAGAALIFKGSGFYKTDYRSDSYSKGAAADKKAEGGSGADSKSSGADSKSAADSKSSADGRSSADSKSSAKGSGEKSTNRSKPRGK